MSDERPSLEAEAKAALLTFLKASGRIGRSSVLILELNIARQMNRADLVTVNSAIHCYEIKTRRDRLTRLERQLSSYASAADYVTVVAATRHINTIMSKVESYVGILEIVEFNQRLEIREVRQAGVSTHWAIEAALDLLPATEIRARLLKGTTLKRRSELVELVKTAARFEVRDQIVSFLRDRYAATTESFLKQVARRDVRANDLTALRVWKSGTALGASMDNSPHKFGLSIDCDIETYNAIGSSFGPVPDDVQRLLRG